MDAFHISSSGHPSTAAVSPKRPNEGLMLCPPHCRGQTITYTLNKFTAMATISVG